MEMICLVLAYYFVNESNIYFLTILFNNFCYGASFTTMTVGCSKVFTVKYGTAIYRFVILGSL